MSDLDNIPTDIFEERFVSPCNKGCPAHIDIPHYIALILEGKLEDAYYIIRNNNPFPAVTGRVCPHPCEKVCRRADFDKAVSICVLKSVAADRIQHTSNLPPESLLPATGRSIGIIGSGPAGLTCAYFLSKLGHEVIIYEAAPVPGGMIAMGIPEFRIPMELMLWEIEMMQRTGFKIQLNTRIGKDISFESLEERHDALFLAAGLPRGKNIGLPGESAPGFYEAVDFLRDVKVALHLKKPLPKVGENVIVLGGGNVAIDVVRTVRRMGAKTIQLYCIEQRKEMPAWESEIEEALEEGACLENSWGPEKILLDENGHVKGVLLKECSRVFDEGGKFNPQYCMDHTMTIEGDMIIKAFGQSPDIEFIRGKEGIQFFRNQWVTVDPVTKKTGRKGVFAGGDMLKPGLLIDAIADGREAAKSIDLYLGGTGKLHIDTSINVPLPQLSWQIQPVTRIAPRFIEMKERETSFKESLLLMTKEEANHECIRCLSCETPIIDQNKCMGCGTCVKSCPHEAISFKINTEIDFFGSKKVRKAIIDPSKCQTCSVCFTECPIHAISMQKWGDLGYASLIQAFVRSGGK